MSNVDSYTSQFQLVAVGGNNFINCGGTVNLDGVEQILLERGQNDDQLLVTIDLFDPAGKRIGKFRRNAWAFNEEPTYAITTTPSNLSLIEVATGEPVFVADVVGQHEISVTRADLYGCQGTHFYVGPIEVDGQQQLGARVNGITLIGNTLVDCPKGVVVTPYGFSM